jgi:hypothetical protein
VKRHTFRHWRCPKCGHEETTALPATAVWCRNPFGKHPDRHAVVAMKPFEKEGGE